MYGVLAHHLVELYSRYHDTDAFTDVTMGRIVDKCKQQKMVNFVTMD